MGAKKHYILCMQRDMQSHFTFMQRIEEGSTHEPAVEIFNKVNELGFFEVSFGKSWIVACEVLNYREGMDLDDMLLQHPHVSDWVMNYMGNYQFKRHLVF